MKDIFKKLTEDLDGLIFSAANYRKWIKECKTTKNDYGVESYSEGLRETMALILQYKEAIQILKTHLP